MIRTLYIITLLFVYSPAFSQVELKDNDVSCNQYEKCYSYIINDSTFILNYQDDNLKILLDSVSYGQGHPFTTRHLLSLKYNVEPENLSLEDTIIQKEWNDAKSEEFYSNIRTVYSKCLENLSTEATNYNLWFQVFRKNEETITIFVKPIKRDKNEPVLLYNFTFNVENIEDVYRLTLTWN